jgi:outer membrane protein TolC
MVTSGRDDTSGNLSALWWPVHRTPGYGPVRLDFPGRPWKRLLDLTNRGASRNINCIMKQFTVALMVLSLTLTALAQTNTTAGATHLNGRPMSLQDCIQEALQHNFDLQIQRYSPQLSLYNLRADYGGFDPTYNISGQHQWYSGGLTNGGYEQITAAATNSIPFPRAPSDANVFKSDLGGTTPWGLQYDFLANVQQGYGTTYSGYTNETSSYGKSTSGNIEMDLTQPLLKDFWIDTTRLTIRVAKITLKSSEQGLRNQFITTVSAVENAYYELIFAADDVNVEQEALNLAQTQLDQDNQRVEIGTMAILDVQQDEAQVEQSKANLIAAQYALVKDQNTLKNLLTDAYATWHDTDIHPTETLSAPFQLFDLQDSWRKGLTERPDLLQAQLSVEKQGIQLKFDRNQLYPSLDLTGTYGYNGNSSDYNGTFDEFGRGDQPYYYYGAKLSMPLGNIQARNNLKADKVSEKQLLLTLKQLEQTIMVGIDNAIKQAQSDYQSVQASRQARIYAAAALDAEQKKYAVGKSTTFTVLQLQNALTSARSQEIRALANYNEDLANLAVQEGTTLERNNIEIQAK